MISISLNNPLETTLPTSCKSTTAKRHHAGFALFQSSAESRVLLKHQSATAQNSNSVCRVMVSQLTHVAVGCLFSKGVETKLCLSYNPSPCFKFKNKGKVLNLVSLDVLAETAHWQSKDVVSVAWGIVDSQVQCRFLMQTAAASLRRQVSTGIVNRILVSNKPKTLFATRVGMSALF